MSINKINLDLVSNISKKAFVPSRKQVSFSADNSQEICSTDAASAIKAANVPKTKNYTFLQHVNIPALNLSGNLYILPNGQKCFVAKNDKPCMIKTYFNVGAINEPDNLRGISHFIEHNIFNGSKNYKPNEFVEKTNKMGAMYNASTGYNMTDYYILSPLHKDTDLEEFIKMHADMLIHPTFPDDMIEKEKGPVVAELQMYEDKPEQLALNTVLKSLFNIKTTSPDLVAGNVQNIRRISRDDVINYYKQHYSPENAITFVVGDVDEEKTMELLSKYFAEFKTAECKEKKYEKLIPITQSVRKDLYSPNTKSTLINLGFSGANNPKDRIVVDLLLKLLTGYKNARLSAPFRDMNLDIESGCEKITNQSGQPDMIMFSTATTQNNEEDILRFIYQKIHELTYMPVSEKELNTVKKMSLNDLKIADSNPAITNIISKEYVQNGSFDSLVNFEKNLNSITSADIMNAAKKFLDLNKVAISVVHPQHKKQISFNGKIKKTDEIKTYITPNNAQISFLNIPDSQFYSLNLELANDNVSCKIGVASILGEMLKHGTSMMYENDFYAEQEENSIKANSSTDRDSITLCYHFPKESLNIAFDNLYKNLFYPALTLENFEKAKATIKNAYLTTQRMASDRAIETLYAGTPKEISLRKLYEDIDKISYYDVITFYNQLMQNSKCKVALSGNISDGIVSNNIYGKISSIGKFFAPVTQSPQINIPQLGSTMVVTESDNRNQANIVKAFHIKESGNVKDKATILLLNEVLGGNSNSRLFQDLREKQKLAYYAHSEYDCTNNAGTLMLNIGTTTDDPANPEQYKNMQKAINGFNYHIDKLINEKVSSEELEAAKLQLKSKLIFMTQTINGKNSMVSMGMNTLYKEQYYKKLLEVIETVTPENIQNIAKYYLTKPSVISVIASKESISKNQEYLKNLGELKQF